MPVQPQRVRPLAGTRHHRQAHIDGRELAYRGIVWQVLAGAHGHLQDLSRGALQEGPPEALHPQKFRERFREVVPGGKLIILAPDVLLRQPRGTVALRHMALAPPAMRDAWRPAYGSRCGPLSA